MTAHPAAVGTTRPTRVAALDGLRGVAALVVLVHHTLIQDPRLRAPYFDPHATDVGSVAWWMTYTPLHLVWDGSVAVSLFFVLSGYVLTLLVDRPGHRWLPYYPQRLLRLYLPTWAAIALVEVWHAVSGRLGGSSYVRDWRAIGNDALLVGHLPGATITVLWSLKWEVLFSLTLPAFVLLARWHREWWWAKILVALAVGAAGAVVGPASFTPLLGALYQLPLFAIGVVLAAERERLRPVIARVGRSARVGVGVLSVVLLGSYWSVYAGPGRSAWQPDAAVVARVLQMVGVALALVAALGPLGRPLRTGVAQWLGRRSFSLYLVHLPVVIALSHLLDLTSPVLLLVTIPASLLAAEVFFRVAERPSLRLSRQVARRLGGAPRRSGSSVGEPADLAGRYADDHRVRGDHAADHAAGADHRAVADRHPA